MASKQDLVLFAGLAVLGFYATQVVHKQLLAVRTAREVTPTTPLAGAPAEVTEDVPNCFDSGRPTAFRSIIACLCHQLPLSQQFETAQANGQGVFRTQPEYDALELLDVFLKRFGVQLALECNAISLWLTKYPSGADPGAKQPNGLASQLAAKRRVEHAARFEQTFSSIIGAFVRDQSNKVGVERMPEYGAIVPNVGSEDADDQQISQDEYARIWYEIHGTNAAPDTGLGPMMRRNPRAHDESPEEQLLRRRRREAMVLGEMGRPIERDDIIQRVDT
ncbi:MAG: hypothetical protein LQ346_002573 [Caloplaca aetnensis]|nr:MAG: hypothetical protein LQ346_002573 [Caloplaca aetnensis]